jgi:CHRD domain-containing protein
VCWTIEVAGVEPITDAHIHVAPATKPGPVVVPLRPYEGGCTEVTRDLALAIILDPGAYYVNVHNPLPFFPAGALGGQLDRWSCSSLEGLRPKLLDVSQHRLTALVVRILGQRFGSHASIGSLVDQNRGACGLPLNVQIRNLVFVIADEVSEERIHLLSHCLPPDRT